MTEQNDLVHAPKAVGALGANLFGDTVNLYSGTLSFSQTDVSLPGNGTLPMAVGRSLTAGRVRQGAGLFSQWDIEIPRLHGVFSRVAGWATYPNSAGVKNARCSSFGLPPGVTGTGGSGSGWDPNEYWSGSYLYVPGVGD